MSPPRTPPLPRKVDNAFTLIELLAGILIVIVLAALLFPTLTKSADKAKQAACVGKLKQIGAVCFAYANDNQGELPGGANTGLTNWGDIWVFKLASYLPSSVNGPNATHVLWSASLKCPSDKKFDTCGASYGPVMGSDSFFGKCAGGVAAGTQFRPIRLSEITSPSKTPYWVEIDNTDFIDGLNAGAQAKWQRPGIHSKGSNVLMADGHIQWVRADEWSESGGTPHPWAYHFVLDYPKPNW